MAKERCLNQFGTAVLVRCGKSPTESVEVLSNLTLARHTVRHLNHLTNWECPRKGVEGQITAKERRLNQFGTAFLVWCGKSVKFDRVCRTFVELNLGSTHGTPVSLQSQTYSVRFGTWKVRRLNQALLGLTRRTRCNFFPVFLSATAQVVRDYPSTSKIKLRGFFKSYAQVI